MLLVGADYKKITRPESIIFAAKVIFSAAVNYKIELRFSVMMISEATAFLLLRTVKNRIDILI